MKIAAHFCIAACIALAAFTPQALAAPGDLDLSFGGTGKVTTGSGPSQSIALQPDGKILTAGWGIGGGGSRDFEIVRFNSNGSLDTGFNGTGKVFTDFDLGEDIANSIAVQSDGKILVAGEVIVSGKANFGLARYNSDGTLDASFNGSGKVITAFGAGMIDRAYALALQNDGKIIAGGYSQNSEVSYFALARYHADGSLDTTFGEAGKVIAVNGSCHDLALQSDGKIVAAGYRNDTVVARYNVDGSLDLSFNGTGFVITNVGGSDGANGVAVQIDGKIVVGGYSSTGFTYKVAVVRYHSKWSA